MEGWISSFGTDGWMNGRMDKFLRNGWLDEWKDGWKAED